MAKLNRLNSLTVQKSNKAGLLPDGGGLYLQISKSGTKSWVFRYTLNKKSRMAGLGALETISLSVARERAGLFRKKLSEGVDPIDSRNSERLQTLLEKAKEMTFDEAAKSYIEAHRAGWKNAKHAAQWKYTIETYASPIIGKLPVCDIDTSLVMKVIEPIWYKIAETASRLRNRIELVLSWSTVRGYRFGDNPARWTGHLDQLLPRRSDIQKRKHFTALPFSEMGAFIENLRKLGGVAPLALEFCILCATRTNETMGAQFAEINDDIWTIPATRMKSVKVHRVPLSSRAIEIIQIMRNKTEGNLIFPGRSSDNTLSNNAFLAVIKNRLKINVTGHGFRSTFRDWASECTNFPREVVEMALAHSIKDATEAAYRRGDLMLKRQILMNDWAKFCLQGKSKVAEVIELQKYS